MTRVSMWFLGKLRFQRDFNDSEVAGMVAHKLASDNPLRTVKLGEHFLKRDTRWDKLDDPIADAGLEPLAFHQPKPKE